MADDDARKLFVAGLSDSVTEEVLRGLFSSTGATSIEVNVPRDRATGRPRGFAFVTLGSGEEAAKARSVLDGSLQGGRSIAVRPFSAEGAAPREGRAGPPGGGGGGGDSHSTEERTLYVRNLPYECTRDELAEVFKSAGVSEVERVHLPVGPDGRAKGFGFVTLRNAAAAQAALPSLQNISLRGRQIVANIARAREDRDRDRPPMGGPSMMRDMPPAPPVTRGGEGRRDPRRFDGSGPPAREGGGEGDEAAKAKKTKKRAGGADRDRKRRDEGLKSPRGRAELGDWDDD